MLEDTKANRRSRALQAGFEEGIRLLWEEETEEKYRVVAKRMCEEFGQDPDSLVSMQNGPKAVSRFGHQLADLDIYPAWVWFYRMAIGAVDELSETK